MTPAHPSDAVREAAEHVCWFDWSNNDSDAVASIEKLRSVLALPLPDATGERLEAMRTDGHCFYCREMTNRFAGNPGLWPLQFCQPDGTGITRFHHTSCVVDRLRPVQDHPVRTALADAADWCETEGYKIGAVDGYDYRSGEEFGLRTAQIELRKRAAALRAAPQPVGNPLTAGTRKALSEIIRIDQKEKSICIDSDPAGNTYTTTMVDGPCAQIARVVLDLSLPAEGDANTCDACKKPHIDGCWGGSFTDLSRCPNLPAEGGAREVVSAVNNHCALVRALKDIAELSVHSLRAGQIARKALSQITGDVGTLPTREGK